MARDAFRSRGMGLRASHVVALLANRRVVPRCSLAAWNIVWIMASRACERAAALSEARRLHQPVYRTDELESILVARALRVIERQRPIGQRLARPIREYAAVEPDQFARQLH